MDGVHTSFRGDAHDYTRSKTPWILGEHKGTYGKLMHYLSGGGMSSLGRTVAQEEARFKHIRFLTFAAVFGALWLLLYLF